MILSLTFHLYEVRPVIDKTSVKWSPGTDPHPVGLNNVLVDKYFFKRGKGFQVESIWLFLW